MNMRARESRTYNGYHSCPGRRRERIAGDGAIVLFAQN
jgi:hypothetical protein